MEISPDALAFQAPFAEQLTKPLRLRNTTNGKLVYKIKTTAPKLYCVRPNASVIEAGETIEVSIIRQAKEQPKDNEKSKDKFLVLSAPVSDDVVASSDISGLWTTLEQTKKESIDSKKIKVVYDFQNLNRAASTVSGSTGTAVTANPPPAYESRESTAAITPADTTIADQSIIDPHQYATPAKSVASDAGSVAKSLAASAAASTPGSVTGSTVIPGSPESTTGSTKATTNTASTTGSSLSDGNESTLKARNIKSDVDEASEIAQQKITSESNQLKAAAAAASKRSSSNEPGFKSSQSPVVSQQSTGGVPLQFVLILALITFLIGWQFF